MGPVLSSAVSEALCSLTTQSSCPLPGRRAVLGPQALGWPCWPCPGSPAPSRESPPLPGPLSCLFCVLAPRSPLGSFPSSGCLPHHCSRPWYQLGPGSFPLGVSGHLSRCLYLRRLHLLFPSVLKGLPFFGEVGDEPMSAGEPCREGPLLAEVYPWEACWASRSHPCC